MIGQVRLKISNERSILKHFLGNPNEQPTETFIWENFVGTERWNELGINKFASYGIDDDQRKERCGMLDEIQHYMLH